MESTRICLSDYLYSNGQILYYNACFSMEIVGEDISLVAPNK